MTRPKVIDLFCGAGGASLGFIRAGCEVIGAVDADEVALDVYHDNLCDQKFEEFPGTVTFEEPLHADLSRGYLDEDVDDDLWTVKFKDILDYFNIESGEVDIICGCPPCQNFSSLRDTDPWNKEEPKDNLLRAFVEHVQEEVPDYVFFENVSNIMKAGEEVPTTYVDWLIRQMEETTRPADSINEGGYGHRMRVLNAANYGVPQKRHRTIGLFKYGADSHNISLPRPTHTKNPSEDDDRKEWQTVRDVLKKDDLKEDLKRGEKQKDVSGYPDDPAHRARNHQDSTVEMVSAIRKHGGSWKDLRDTDQEDLIRECHQNLDGGAASAYGIMDWNKPAPTLTTRCTNISSGRFTHPSQNRAITFREAALLMGFPRWFELPSINGDAERVVGNAVPRDW
ncbi:DNA cytosine methyltransferase [Haloarculaceae archaeon H-GB2-1]|nr:DNA cytosine methyltransferase [Haloarculaceae archaeon H-GB2-1]